MSEERLIPLAGACNCRDVGGYGTTTGRRVKWGMVFRSDDLNDLTRRDIDILRDLAIATVVDFRAVGEAAAAPDRLPASVCRYVNLPIDAARMMHSLAESDLTRGKAVAMMISAYRMLVNDFQDVYRELFRLLANPDNHKVLFHCTAGKDRTGLAAALFLSGLGVGRATVVDDYLISRERLRTKYVAGVDYDSALEPLYSVMPEFIDSAFAVIDCAYGGVDAFLAGNLGVDLELLRDMYTE